MNLPRDGGPEAVPTKALFLATQPARPQPDTSLAARRSRFFEAEFLEDMYGLGQDFLRLVGIILALVAAHWALEHSALPQDVLRLIELIDKYAKIAAMVLFSTSFVLRLVKPVIKQLIGIVVLIVQASRARPVPEIIKVKDEP